MTVPDPYCGASHPAAPAAPGGDEWLNRRAVFGKLMYVAPTIVALNVAQPAVALGRSGPHTSRGKVPAHGKGKNSGKGNGKNR
jgi:hypothetical protein